ncbi:MAG: ADP-ribosylation factor family protein [Candidatus Heimdallarchaeota archaeon]
MSFLLNLFKKKAKPVTVTICGLDKAGKTAIINYLIHGEFKETTPTMGVNREVINFPKLQINIFDMGGQADFRPIWQEINEKTDALIYVIDSVDHMRFDETKTIFNDILDNQIGGKIPVLILLNKKDLPDRIAQVDLVKSFGLIETEYEIEWAVFETSAKTGDGIIEAFSWFKEKMEER